MMIKTTWLKDHDPVPDSAKPQLPFVTTYRQTSHDQNDRRACVPEADSSLAITNIKDGTFVAPWMQFVRMEAKGCAEDSPKVYLCQATEKGPDDFLKDNDPKSCNHGVELHLADKKEKSGKKELVYQFVPSNFDLKKAYENHATSSDSLLQPGGNYAICTATPTATADHRPYCIRFTVYTPFFQYPNWPEKIYPDWSKEGGRDNRKQHYTNPSLYVLKNAGPEDKKLGLTPVVIFGIVDPKMLENIGADNYSWQTMTVKNSQPKDKWNKEYKTQVFIADPIQTLTELQRYFEQDYCFHHGGHRFQGIRVLLAQMRPEQARELAEHLPKSVRFNAVISAADNTLATPSQTIQMSPAVLTDDGEADDAGNMENTACGKEPSNNIKLLAPTTFIAAPARHDAATTRWLQARKLRITSDGGTRWDYEVSGEPIRVSGVPSVKELACVEDSFWQRVYDRVCGTDEKHRCDREKPRDGESDMAALQQLVLLSIRDKVHADIALLQEKDFYHNGLKDYLAEHCQLSGDSSTGCAVKCGPNYASQLNIQQILERIVWKGDFIQSQSVTGSVLKTILKKSEQYAETEQAGYIPVDERGRPLVTLGTRPDPNNTGEYLINGKPLDSNSLYTVALSDFIGLGDTGYPELATPPVGDPDPPASPSERVFTVSAVTCREIESSNSSNSCNKDIPGRDFPDRADRKPDDARAVNTNFHKFYAWTFLRRRLGQRTGRLPAASRSEAVQAAMQQRVEDGTNWNWSFDKLSVGFSGVTHTDSEQTVSQKFGGVLSPVVTVPHSHSWDWDANSKLTFYHPKADWFVSDILQYSSSFTSQVSGPRNETQPRNQFVFEGGNYFHLYPKRGKELPQLSLALSGHFETFVGSPITTLQIAGSTFPLVFEQGHTFLLLGRSGIRWENRKSFVEGGLEGGQTLNAIRQFDILVAPNGPIVPCRLEATVSLTTCINNFNQANPATPVTNTSTVSVQRSPQDRYGAYWAMRTTVPINNTVSYNFQDLSDYFFLSSGDNSADTRFRHHLIHTLKFMVFPNLSFEPTYTMYFYENKLDYNFLFQQQYSIKINYSFTLSNWNEGKRQFKYKKPASQ
jgi:5'-nucleotidase-like protein